MIRGHPAKGSRLETANMAHQGRHTGFGELRAERRHEPAPFLDDLGQLGIAARIVERGAGHVGERDARRPAGAITATGRSMAGGAAHAPQSLRGLRFVRLFGLFLGFALPLGDDFGRRLMVAGLPLAQLATTITTASCKAQKRETENERAHRAKLYRVAPAYASFGRFAYLLRRSPTHIPASLLTSKLGPGPGPLPHHPPIKLMPTFVCSCTLASLKKCPASLVPSARWMAQATSRSERPSLTRSRSEMA